MSKTEPLVVGKYYMYRGKGVRYLRHRQEASKSVSLEFWVEPHDEKLLREYADIIDKALLSKPEVK